MKLDGITIFGLMFIGIILVAAGIAAIHGGG